MEQRGTGSGERGEQSAGVLLPAPHPVRSPVAYKRFSICDSLRKVWSQLR